MEGHRRIRTSLGVNWLLVGTLDVGITSIEVTSLVYRLLHSCGMRVHVWIVGRSLADLIQLAIVLSSVVIRPSSDFSLLVSSTPSRRPYISYDVIIRLRMEENATSGRLSWLCPPFPASCAFRSSMAHFVLPPSRTPAVQIFRQWVLPRNE